MAGMGGGGSSRRYGVRNRVVDGVRNMKLAIVGSVGPWTETAWARARFLVIDSFEIWSPTLLVSGGADGIDTLAEEIADLRGVEKLIHPPRIKRWGGPGGFRERNIRIAEDCDRLVAIRSRLSTTYGSGWTADYAEGLGKGVERIIL